MTKKMMTVATTTTVRQDDDNDKYDDYDNFNDDIGEEGIISASCWARNEGNIPAKQSAL